MKVLLDTNTLVRLMHVGHPSRAVAREALSRLREARHELHTVPQVLYEYWSVATRPASQNGLGFPVELVHEQLRSWQSLFPALPDERGVFESWLSLVVMCRMQGKQAHDAHLAAALVRQRLTHLLTFNGDDFRRFSQEAILDPMALAESRRRKTRGVTSDEPISNSV
jgi:predicted nucleic acid-binding protein